MRMHGRDLSQCDGVNKLDDSSTHGAHRAQWCAVITSVCIVMFTQLVTVVSGLSRLCVKIYAVFRSLFVS